MARMHVQLSLPAELIPTQPVLVVVIRQWRQSVSLRHVFGKMVDVNKEHTGQMVIMDLFKVWNRQIERLLVQSRGLAVSPDFSNW